MTGQQAGDYRDYVGQVNYTKPSDATIRFYFEGQKGSVTTRDPANGFHTESNRYNFKDWEVNNFPINRVRDLIHYTYITTRLNGISGVALGETRTSKLIVQIRKDGVTLAEETVTVTISNPHPSLSLDWDSGISGTITVDGSSSYSDFTGRITHLGFNQSDIETETATIEEVRAGRSTFGAPGGRNSAILANATLYPAKDFPGTTGGTLNYGSWAFTGEKFKFRPSANGINNNLNPGETVTTQFKWSLTINDNGKSVQVEDTITVTIIDTSSPPILSITTTMNSVFEGDSIPFSVTTGNTPKRNFTVVFDTSQSTGNYFSSISTVGFTQGGPRTQTGSVTTVDQTGIQADGTVVVSITDQGAYNVDTTNPSISVTVRDNDGPPVLSIAATLVSVDEGDSIPFTVTASKNLESTFTVVFDTSQSTGNYFGSISTVGFTQGGTRTQTGSVTTVDQTGIQADGTVVVRITDTNNYNVDTDNPSISVSVMDTDRIDVSVTAPIESVVEGELAEFTITADTAPSDGMIVNVEVELTGNVLSLWAPNQVVIPAGKTSIQYGLATNKFNYSDVPGTITVKILPGENYRPKDGFDSPAAKAMVTVEDNGLTAATASGVSVASIALGQILAQSSATSPAAPQSVVDAQHIAIDEFDQLDGTVPTVSVTAVQLSVKEGDAVQFRLQSTHAVARSLGIAVHVTSSNATLADELPVQVGLHAGETETRVVIPTTTDGLAGDDGAVVLTVRSGAGYLVAPDHARATVKVSDASDRAGRGWELQTAGLTVHSEILGSLASHSLFTAASRFERAFESVRQNSFKLGGINSMAELITLGGESLNGNTAPWQSVLHGTAFEVDGSPTAGGVGPTTFWGRGDYRAVAGRNGDSATDWTGGIFSGQLGLDTTVGGGVLLGLAASEVVSEFEYDIGESRPLRLESRSSGVYPYIGIKPATKEFQLLVTAGYGMSETLVRQERYEPETQSGIFHMVGLNGRGQLYADGRGRESGTTALKVTGKTWYAGQNMAGTAIPELEVAGGHARIGLAAVHERAAVDGTGYGSSLAMELRMDERNDRSFAGVEFENQTNVELPVGLKVAGTGLALMSGVNRVASWAVSMTANYDSNHDDLGMMVAFQPAMGWTDARLEGILWSDNLLGGIDSVPRPNGPGIDTEVAYGLDTHDGKGQVTPFVGFELGRSNQTTYQIGSRYSVDANLAIELVGKQQFTDSNSTNRRLDLKETLSW